MRVSTPLERLESITAVVGATSPGSGIQNARTRASSSSFSIAVLLTWFERVEVAPSQRDRHVQPPPAGGVRRTHREVVSHA